MFGGERRCGRRLSWPISTTHETNVSKPDSRGWSVAKTKSAKNCTPGYMGCGRRFAEGVTKRVALKHSEKPTISQTCDTRIKSNTMIFKPGCQDCR